MILHHAGLILKQTIKSVLAIETQPLDPSLISLGKMEEVVPVELLQFLKQVCGEEKGMHLKLLSAAQSLIYIASSGRKIMPKHVALAMSLKTALRSKDYITVINRLGDCISYNQVLVTDAYWANCTQNSSDGYAMVPTNIIKGVFAQAASDNADYNTASSSHHVTNSVIYQYPMSSVPSSIAVGSFSAPKKRSRLRSMQLQELSLCQFYGKDEPDVPDYIKSCNPKGILDACRYPSNERIKSFYKNTAWHLSRSISLKTVILEPSSINYPIPGWKGFNYVLSTTESFPTIIGNCRTIPAPPTDLNAVYTVIISLIDLLKKINQSPAIITCDESFYEKAMLVKWNHEDVFKDSLVLRLGNFHRRKNFIGVIGKRMRSSGFENILEESGLYKEGRIEGILTGRLYNTGMIAHKVMFEILNFKLWEKFQDWIKWKTATAAHELNSFDTVVNQVEKFLSV